MDNPSPSKTKLLDQEHLLDMPMVGRVRLSVQALLKHLAPQVSQWLGTLWLLLVQFL